MLLYHPQISKGKEIQVLILKRIRIWKVDYGLDNRFSTTGNEIQRHEPQEASKQTNPQTI